MPWKHVPAVVEDWADKAVGEDVLVLVLWHDGGRSLKHIACLTLTKYHQKVMRGRKMWRLQRLSSTCMVLNLTRYPIKEKVVSPFSYGDLHRWGVLGQVR